MSHHTLPRMMIALAVAAMGCDGFAPIEFRVPGRIFDDPPDDPALSHPDTVGVGQAFEVTVRTAGGGCSRKGDTEVVLFGDSAVVAPYDMRIMNRGRETLCPGYLAIYSHVATISFPRPGEGLLIVRGTAFPSNAPLELRRAIVVE